MSFFKKAGKALKSAGKMLSIKNITKVASGGGAGLTTELLGRVSQPFTAKASVQNSAPVTMLDNALTLEMQKQSDSLVKKIASNQKVADTTDNVNKFLTKVYWQTNWNNYKNYVYALLAILSVIGIYYAFFKKKTGRARTRR